MDTLFLIFLSVQMSFKVYEKSELFFDVHLMLSNPNMHYESFIRAGADLITIHVEPKYLIEETILRLKIEVY